MADELKIPSFSKQKKLKTVTVSTTDPLPPTKPTPVAKAVDYVPLTDEQIESCRKGQDIFDFARDIEEIIRVNNKI